MMLLCLGFLETEYQYDMWTRMVAILYIPIDYLKRERNAMDLSPMISYL